MLFISYDHIIKIHGQVLALGGGLSGVKHSGLLESSIFQPQLKIGKSYAHPTIYDMAAAYLFHLVKNHPFNDANKRTSLACMLIFLRVNGININSKTLTSLVLETAQAKSPDFKNKIANRLLNLSVNTSITSMDDAINSILVDYKDNFEELAKL